MRRIWFFIPALLIIALGATFLAYNSLKYACSRSEYTNYTARRMKGYQRFKKHNPQEIILETEDGLKLSAFLVVRPQAKRVFLICHGRWQAKEIMSPFADMFADDTLLFIDFRAHGSSEGQYCSFGYHEVKDIRAAVRFLVCNDKTHGLPIYGLGLSMGSVALIGAAQQGCPFAGLILDSGFSSLSKQLDRALRKKVLLPVSFRWLAHGLYKRLMSESVDQVVPSDLMAKIKIPVFIIHSEQDRVVPVMDAYDLYDKAAGIKKIWIVPEGRHVRTHKKRPCEYKKRVMEFIQSFEAPRSIKVGVA